MKCKVCNEQVADGAVFCNKCGADLREQKSEGPVSAFFKDDSGKLKNILLIVGGIIVVGIVALLLFKGIASIGKADFDEFGTQLVMAMEVSDDDDVEGYILDGGKVIELPDDVGYAVVVSPTELMVYSNVGDTDDNYRRISDLTLYNFDGDELCSDKDVVLNTYLNNDSGIMWYLKQDDEEFIICNIVDGETNEVSDGIEDLFNFAGTADENLAYYLVGDYYGDEFVLYKLEDGDEDEIYTYDADDGYIYLLSRDGKVFLLEIEYEADNYVLYILDDDNMEEVTDDFFGIEDFENNKLFIINSDDELVVCDLEGNCEELDDFDFSFTAIGDNFYYSNGDDLMVIDTSVNMKDIDPEYVVKDIFKTDSDLWEINFFSDKVYAADDDEIEVTDIKTGKTKTVEAEEDVAYIFSQDRYFEDGCLFIDEDDAMYFYNGKKVILIEKDAEDVTDAQIAFDGSKIIWVDDEDLMMCDINGKNVEEIERDVDWLFVSWEGTVYIETNDDEILVLSKNGKTEEILSDVELNIEYKD